MRYYRTGAERHVVGTLGAVIGKAQFPKDKKKTSCARLSENRKLIDENGNHSQYPRQGFDKTTGENGENWNVCVVCQNHEQIQVKGRTRGKSTGENLVGPARGKKRDGRDL